MSVGYSSVEDDGLLVTTDWQAAADMMTVLKALVEEVPTLQSSPLFRSRRVIRRQIRRDAGRVRRPSHQRLRDQPHARR